MRRVRPLLAALLAVLLLAQWGGAAAACLASLRLATFGGVICHAEGGPVSDHNPVRHEAACAHCAPLPPALAAVPPALPPVRTAAYAVAAAPAPGLPAPRPVPSPFQPRGPPLPA